MAYITKYGDFWGQVPRTSGRIFWVAPAATYTVEGRTYPASDGQDGLSPERALLTLNQAILNATASVGDVIVLLPGAHSWTATQTLSKAGLTITGIPRGNPMSSGRGASVIRPATTVTSTGNILTPTAADIEIAHIHFIPALGFAGIKPSAAATRLFVHDCTWSVTTAADSATTGFDMTWTGTTTTLSDLTIRNCYFYNEGANGPAIRAQATTIDLVIENCTFKVGGDTAWDDAVELVSTSLGTTVRDCDFIERASGTVITDCLDIAGATTDGATTVLRCYFPVGSNALTNANVADNQCAENYLMQAAASVGGTLILST